MTDELPDDPLSTEILKTIDALPHPEPSGSFDARMRERLDAIDAERPWWARFADAFTVPRVSIAAAAGAVAVLIFVVFAGPRHEKHAPSFASMETIEIAEDLELFENYDLIEDLDVLEDLELIEELDEAG